MESEDRRSGTKSRRKFLKKVGSGAFGLTAGALLSSGAGLDFESASSGIDFRTSSGNNFKIGSSGNLDLEGKNLQNVGTVQTDSLELNGTKRSTWPSGGGSSAPKVFNVRDYGAVGDGVTDNQSAFQSAVDDAVANAPAVVYIPAGEYLVDTNSNQRDAIFANGTNVEIRGEGPFSTILIDSFAQGASADGSSGKFLRMGGTDTESGPNTGTTTTEKYVGVRDIGIRNVDGFSANNISLENFDYGYVDNVWIDNTMNDQAPGLPIAVGFAESSLENSVGRVTNCITHNKLPNNKSIEVSGVEKAYASGNIILTNPKPKKESNDPQGMSIHSNQYSYIKNNIIELPTHDKQTAPGIQVLGNKHVNVEGNIIVGGGKGITLGGIWKYENQEITVRNNRIIDSKGRGISIDSPTKVTTITGNDIRNTGSDAINFATRGEFIISNNHIRNPGGKGITNVRGSQTNILDYGNIIGNVIHNPGTGNGGAEGIAVHEPRNQGGIIALNQVNECQSGNPHIAIRDPENNGPNSFIVALNNSQRSGEGVVVDGSTSNSTVTLNN